MANLSRLEFAPESLEHRHMLSGVVNVTANNSSIRIVGDGESNSITVSVHVATQTVRVTGTDNETIIGGITGVPVSQLKNLTVQLRGGFDLLSINAPVSGNVRIVGGSGGDAIGINGNVGGRLKISGGSGVDFITLSSSVSGQTNVALGGDDDMLFANGATFGDRTRFALGGGDDTVKFFNSVSFAERSSVSMGGGDDRLDIQSSTAFVMPFSANGGGGTDDLDNDALLPAGSKIRSFEFM